MGDRRLSTRVYELYDTYFWLIRCDHVRADRRRRLLNVHLVKCVGRRKACHFCITTCQIIRAAAAAPASPLSTPLKLCKPYPWIFLFFCSLNFFINFKWCPKIRVFWSMPTVLKLKVKRHIYVEPISRSVNATVVMVKIILKTFNVNCQDCK